MGMGEVEKRVCLKRGSEVLHEKRSSEGTGAPKRGKAMKAGWEQAIITAFIS